MGRLRIGTCSWKYDSWEGIIYSNNAKANYLREYSDHFDTVEIDQWFWSLFGENKVNLPNPKVLDNYIESVPDDFKFTIKLPNSISLTHYYKKSKNDSLKSNPYFLSKELFLQVVQMFNAFGDKLGPMMLQFEYLNKQKMNSQMDFLIRMKGFLDSIKSRKNLALEIRNPNYLNSSFFEFIQEESLIPVFLQGYYMPPVFDIYDKFKEFISGTVVIRLHGPDRKAIEEKSGGDWSKIIAPRDDELQKIIEMVNELLSRNVDVYLNVNNHYEGSAPLTINKIRELL